ncbi:hypothetical protein ACFVZR_12945 [Streptomyces sp. NPDC058316]
MPPFPSGAGGLVATVDDWSSFARMLLAGGGPTGAGTRQRSGFAKQMLLS